MVSKTNPTINGGELGCSIRVSRKWIAWDNVKVSWPIHSRIQIEQIHKIEMRSK
jgi:hypothetical protein